ncbi:MAG: hypothetical protein RhofKO_11140 [Rhodothermales bacterium]
MICNRIASGWEIIYQRAHAILAAQLIQYWNEAERPARWLETLSATAQHDNGWQEWESASRLTDQHIPRDFTETPIADYVSQSERVVHRACHQSLWCGLLVSRHVSWLYEPLRGEDSSLDALLNQQKTLRRAWRSTLKLKVADIDYGYAFLQWGDALSLILCKRQLPIRGRALEIAPGPDGTRYDVAELEDGVLSITPWPFDRNEFAVHLDTHCLDQLTFDSESDLADALDTAAVQPRCWTLKKA